MPFVGYKSSWRLKFALPPGYPASVEVGITPATNEVFQPDPHTVFDDLSDQMMAGFKTITYNAGGGGEVLVPYYGVFKYINVRIKDDGTNDLYYGCFSVSGMVHTPNPSPPLGVVYGACGPDLTIARFRRIPVIRFTG